MVFFVPYQVGIKVNYVIDVAPTLLFLLSRRVRRQVRRTVETKYATPANLYSLSCNFLDSSFSEAHCPDGRVIIHLPSTPSTPPQLIHFGLQAY